jgi:hypothetical protein
MHDDNNWLRRPILPRPPALPEFGPEMRALIGLDPSDLEKDAVSSEPSIADVETDELDSRGDTRPEALAVTSQILVHGSRAIRTGT